MSKQTVINQLLIMGVPMHTKGFLFLVDALTIILEDMEGLYDLTRTVYPQIAARYNTDVKNVDRCLRTTLQTTWQTGNLPYLEEYFAQYRNSASGKTTVSCFLSVVANRLAYQV